MACKGICEQYKATKPYNSIRYGTGQKRCNMCDIFTKWEGRHCPCCGSKLRIRPRNTRHRTKLMEQVKRI